MLQWRDATPHSYIQFTHASLQTEFWASTVSVALCTAVFLLTRLLLPNGLISAFPPLQRTSTRQLKHFYKHPVDEFLRRLTLRDGAIDGVISKVNPQHRYRHVFSSATTTTYWAPRKARTSLLFIHKKTTALSCLIFWYYCGIFSAAVQPWAGRLVSEKESRGEDGEVSARKRQNERGQACRNHNREHLSSSASLKAASTSLFSRARHRRRRGDTVRARGRGTGDISTQYLISLPSLMHPGVSSPAPSQADR